MGNTCARIHSEKVEKVGMTGRGHDETSVGCDGRESFEQATRSGKFRSDVEERIERSKVHWSQLTDLESSKVHWSELSEREADVDDKEENRQVFEELQLHPTWGNFFKTFGYDTKAWLRAGELVVGKKFAEGGQAELFHAKVNWRNPKSNEDDLEEGREWVLKVFKKGSRLRELRAQWPLGYLQWWASNLERSQRIRPPPVRYLSDVYCGTILEDGRFAFLMEKEHEDLRSRIDRAMLDIGEDHGPFSKDEVERIMFRIALGMDRLHSHNIVHRDLKASNVLVFEESGFFPSYYVMDYECSIGVVGTGFFMAPEILQCMKDKTLFKAKATEVFSKEADVYSYGMTCYEVLTGKLPFQGHPLNDYDLVLNGQRPEIPEYVDSWIRELLNRCWDEDCSRRPLFPDILEILLIHSAVVREVQLDNQKWEKDNYRKYEEKVLQQGLVVEPL